MNGPTPIMFVMFSAVADPEYQAHAIRRGANDYLVKASFDFCGTALAKAEDAKLDTGEMVLTVSFNGDARAYPVREMAYHHIVNDVVGGVPIAATY